MAAVALRREERIGLAVAIAAHVAVVGVLLLKPHSAPVVMPPDRIDVTISDEVGLTSTSPEPRAQAAPDIAPEMGEPPPEPSMPLPVPQVAPPVARPAPLPPVPRQAAKPTRRPEPAKPVVRPTTHPKPAPAKPKARPAPHPRPAPAARPSSTPREKPVTHSGGSRVGADFLKGVPGARSAGHATAQPASSVSASEKASLLAAISRKIKPYWRPPQGADAEKLVTVLRWNLNADGSLAGAVQFIGQEGRTDANRPQWDRHKEMAIRAVELAAPFDLPPQYYNVWKRVGPINFDWKLAQ
jgi:outer membrane biosynthesis protein TonB